MEQCDRCGHVAISYNSCRDRHCPKCQASLRAKWLEARQSELLPVLYFHVVFTLPRQIGDLALQNASAIYGILFRAVAEALLTIAGDPKRLGARIGFLAVLHTWGQKLNLHPHLHCVVPGGGIGLDGTNWVGCRNPSFLLPNEVLGSRFRNVFLDYLEAAFQEGKLRFHGEMAPLAKPPAFRVLCSRAKKLKWVVYAKPPFGGPEQVLKYLAAYTHRVAISNRRLLSMEQGRVSFQWKDYSAGNQIRTMTLEAVEFIRRFLLHVLPAGFVRIRQFGFLANRARTKKLALCRALLVVPSPPEKDAATMDRQLRPQERCFKPCPVCKTGHMTPVGIFVAVRLIPAPHQHSP